MQDQIFGEINQEDGGWHGEYLLDFGGTVCSVLTMQILCSTLKLKGW